jgi:hypothetical protein
VTGVSVHERVGGHPDAPPSGSRRVRWKGRRNLLLLGAVAVFYTVTQLVLVTPDMFLSWDESLYASQFAPGVPAAIMSAPRAFGMAYLIAPVTVFTSSVTAIRVYLSLLSGVGLFLAYWPWLRIRNSVAVPLAAFLLGTLWLMGFYGNQIMPNIYIAYGAVAATALFVRSAGHRRDLPVDQRSARTRRGALGGLGAMFVVLASLRPTDAVWLAAPLLAAALVVRPWRPWAQGWPWARARGWPSGWAPPLVIVGGLVIGWVPWVVDSYARFGGLFGRFEQISEENAATGVRFVLSRHLGALSNHMLVCGAWERDCGGYSIGVILWWTALPLLAGLGLWALRRTPHLKAGLLAVAGASAIAVPYLFVTGHANPRYLLPAYALLAIPAAVGLVRLAAALPAFRLGSVLVGGVVAIHVAAQLWTTHEVTAQIRPVREVDAQVAARLTELGVRPPCYLFGNHAPQIAYATRCRGRGSAVPGLATGSSVSQRVARLLERERAKQQQVAVVALERRPQNFPEGWRAIRLWPGQPWYVHLPPNQ